MTSSVTDLDLPLSTVQRIIDSHPLLDPLAEDKHQQGERPAEVSYRYSKQTVRAIARCGGLFVAYVVDCAAEEARTQNKTVISDEHIRSALKALLLEETFHSPNDNDTDDDDVHRPSKAVAGPPTVADGWMEVDG